MEANNDRKLAALTRMESKLNALDEKIHTHYWPTRVEKNHMLSPRFDSCISCYCADVCIMYKLGAQACTIKDKVMKGKVI